MPLKGFQLTPVIQAHDVVASHGLIGRHGRHSLHGCISLDWIQSNERAVSDVDELRQIRYANGVMGYEAGDYPRGQFD
jgi:hypothetical protein